jgi:uroporphyrin-III C-methyltransferase/precorrin-2 dehydrogenase/sirohydrochlorin ferrochelatase
MNRLPLFVAMAGRSCLVVGGGEVARRKVELLLAVGAKVTVVAPRIDDAIREAVVAAGGELHARRFVARDVRRRALVIAATSDRAVNAAVFAAAERANVLVNTVDDPALCTAIFPSIVDRDPVVVAVSTGGRSPTLAAIVRGWIEIALPARLGALAEFIHARRQTVSARLGDLAGRRAFWREIVEGPVAEAVYRGREAEAEQGFSAALAGNPPRRGLVSLVGAGPGDPELLTIRALRCLEQADVIFYDNLVSPAVLALARRDARRVYVGKRAGLPVTRQAAINELLLEEARAGRRVVRLKGGDPFIFGRGGEEIASLADEGIAHEVIPGITAALGCAAYAGIPLTHRDCAQSVRFVTGHRQGDIVNLDWPELARPGQTLVVYMGLLGIEEIARRLIEHGSEPVTPLALISRGTLPDQQVIVTTLEELPMALASREIHGPTTTIIGEVVRLRIP